MQEEYKFSVNLRGKKVKFRKWKVKDRNKLLSANNDSIITKESLVYDCLEDKTIGLSDEEYKYILLNIRSVSLKEPINFDFFCSSCEKDFEYTADLQKIVKPKQGKLSEIEVGDFIFTMSNIRNREYYDKLISNTKDAQEISLIDFILHISAINDEPLTFDDLLEKINNLDIDVFTEIFEQWSKMRFETDLVHDVQCPHCAAIESYEFDDLPGFFPDTWIN